MSFKKHNISLTYFILFILTIKFTLVISFSPKKTFLRKLWNERIDYDDSQRTSEEKESIEHCVISDYKYFIFYITGQTYEFKEYINEGNAQPLINELTNKGKGNISSYYDHIGVFFIFVGCAFVSIIVWIFNWICWKNNCCCCDFLHNPVNKRIAWWFCFCFLWGIIACCVSAFVTVNRFGFALEGSRCAVDRIYYDSKYGQLKTSQPRWEGFDNISRILNYFDIFIDNVTGFDYFNEILVTEGWRNTSYNTTKIKQLNGYFNQSFLTMMDEIDDNDIKAINEYVLPFSIRYSKLADNLWLLGNTIDSKKDLIENKDFFKNNDFDEIKTEFLDKFYYYAKTGKACLNILTMVYYCILVITIFFTGVCMILYVCLKRQGYLLQIMHVLWNIIRFFIISFFLYGTAYGIFFLVLRDVIAYIGYIFGEQNLSEKHYLLPEKGSQFLKYCLLDKNTNFKSQINNITSSSLNDFFINYKEFGDLTPDQNKISSINLNKKQEVITVVESMQSNYNMLKDKLEKNLTKTALDELSQRAVSNGGLYGSFDCGFLKDDLQHLFRTIYDASVESRILCALSLCSSFFGAIAVYFFLLVMHHYDNDLFFDRGKNIFTGFDGFKGKTRNPNLDPGFKKRKMRTEIEITSEDDDEENNSQNKRMSKTNFKY